MKKTLLASVAVLALGVSLPAFAQDSGVVDPNAGAAIGATGGATAGAAAGAVVGGPIGAIIGGFAGAVIGAQAGVDTATVDYASANPVAPVVIDGRLDAGVAVPAGVTVYPVESDPKYGYLYANGRVWIVDLASNTLVYSPGYVVDSVATDYAVANPVDPIQAGGDVVVGYVLPENTVVTPVPNDPAYGYVYINDRPALVDNSTRTVVWVR